MDISKEKEYSYSEIAYSAPCGCERIEIYIDDPEFSGYDTDRSETKQKFCKIHKNEIEELRNQEKHNNQQISILQNQNENLQKKMKQIYKLPILLKSNVEMGSLP